GQGRRVSAQEGRLTVDRLPIRVRLTAAFALAMLLVLVAAASFVYVRQRSALTETIDHGLERRSDDVAAVIRGSEAGLAYAGRGRLTDPEDTFIQVLTRSGSRVEGTKAVRAPAVDGAESREASNHPTTLEHDLPGIEGTARMLARPVKIHGRPYVL